MKKVFSILGIAIVGLGVLAVILAVFYVGTITKFGLEEAGSQIAQVSIKVDSVDISLLSGSGSFKNLTIGNPQGYATPQAISVGLIAARLDPLSIMSKKILVHSVDVKSAEITFEGGLSQNNLSKISDNVTSSTKNKESSSDNKSAPKIEVDDLLITGSKLHIILSGLVSKDIALPDIHLTDLGKGNDGLTPAELASAVLSAITKDVLKTIAGSVGDLGRGVKDLGTGTIKSVGNNISKITSSFSGLLGK